MIFRTQGVARKPKRVAPGRSKAKGLIESMNSAGIATSTMVTENSSRALDVAEAQGAGTAREASAPGNRSPVATHGN